MSGNMGYEGKIAKRLTAVLTGVQISDAGSIPLDVAMDRFREARLTMNVRNEHKGSAVCRLCGKLHISDIYDTAFVNDAGEYVVMPVGSDCIDNINFIEGHGDCVAVKREFIYGQQKALFLAGALARAAIRRFRISQAHRRRLGLSL